MSFTCHRWALPHLFVLCLFPLAGFAQVTRTELAGNPLAQYPFFEHVRAFNVNAPLNVAIDPTRFPAIVGKTCDVYVVNHKTDWPTSPGLTDVTPGGHMTRTFVGGTIQANTFEVAPASSLSADAGAGLGVGYDVVFDCDRNGSLSNGDFIDGASSEAGLYMVHDITQPGPHAVTDVPPYNLDSTFADGFGIPSTRLGQKLYFPTQAASMGKLPLVIISRGNGHDFRSYGHIGNHLASYGYVVMSHDNNTEPEPGGAATAMLTTIGHTDAFIAMAEGGTIAGGALAGHMDARRIVWIGHSRGGRRRRQGVSPAFRRHVDAPQLLARRHQARIEHAANRLGGACHEPPARRALSPVDRLWRQRRQRRRGLRRRPDIPLARPRDGLSAVDGGARCRTRLVPRRRRRSPCSRALAPSVRPTPTSS